MGILKNLFSKNKKFEDKKLDINWQFRSDI